MQTLMRRCPACWRYTLKAVCPACGGPVRVAVPSRFSPEDHYGKYRRMLIRAP